MTGACLKLHLVRLVEEVLNSFSNPMNQSVRVAKYVETQNKDIDLANTLQEKTDKAAINTNVRKVQIQALQGHVNLNNRKYVPAILTLPA